jgi:uncharacterized protein YijF (DUF1287 family)
MNNRIWIYVSLSFISLGAFSQSFEQKLVDSALDRLNYNVTYDGAYLAIPYPMGDVPANIGVCTDVVIRSYRKVGIDLQKLVHKDMKQAFNSYPSKRIFFLCWQYLCQ